MFVYLLSLPIWNFVLPTYAYWKFDDFSWGNTRKTAGERANKTGIECEGEFDSGKIMMRRWCDFEAGKSFTLFSVWKVLTDSWTPKNEGSRYLVLHRVIGF